MTPELTLLLGHIIDGLLNPTFIAVIATGYISYRNNRSLKHIQDGLGTKAEDEAKKSADANIVVATLTGQEVGRLVGREESKADQKQQGPINPYRRQP